MSSYHRFQISVVIHFRFIIAVGDNSPEVRDRDSFKSESFESRTRNSAPDSSTLFAYGVTSSEGNGYLAKCLQHLPKVKV